MYKLKPNPEIKIEGKPLQVFDPVKNDFLPSEGRCVPESDYWLRRLRDGSVIKVMLESTKKTTSLKVTAKKVTDKTKATKNNLTKAEIKTANIKIAVKDEEK